MCLLQSRSVKAFEAARQCWHVLQDWCLDGCLVNSVESTSIVVPPGGHDSSVAKLPFRGKIRKPYPVKSMVCEPQLFCFRYFATEPRPVRPRVLHRLPSHVAQGRGPVTPPGRSLRAQRLEPGCPSTAPGLRGARPRHRTYCLLLSLQSPGTGFTKWTSRQAADSASSLNVCHSLGLQLPG